LNIKGWSRWIKMNLFTTVYLDNNYRKVGEKINTICQRYRQKALIWLGGIGSHVDKMITGTFDPGKSKAKVYQVYRLS